MHSLILGRRYRSLLGAVVLPLLTVGLILLLFLAYRPSQAAGGGVLNVNSAADTDDGNCNAAHCTLREAILAANGTEGAERIIFSLPPNSVITLVGAQLPPIEGVLTIDGGTAVNLTISGDDASRVLVVGPNPFHYPPPMPTPPPYLGPDESGGEGDLPLQLGGGTAVTLTNLTIIDGFEPYNKGGAIYNSETLVIENSSISGNESKWGAIFNEGSLTIVDSTVSDNKVMTSGGAGGGLYNEDDSILTIIGTTFSGNHVNTNGGGGGLYNDGGYVSITDSTFDGNSGSPGAAIWYEGSGILNITNSSFSNNLMSRALYASGRVNVADSTFSGNSSGALYVEDNSNIDNTVFSGNSRLGDGGAIEIRSSTNVNVSDSVFRNNVAGGGGGAISSNGNLDVIRSTFRDNSSGMSGGAIKQGSGMLTIDETTLNGNTAVNGGAIQIGGGSTMIMNSTISGNTAQSRGGGFYVGGSLTLNNVTVNGNGANSGGGLYNAQMLYLTNSILANSFSGGDCVNLGSIVININNLVEDGGCGAAFNGDPLLSPLQDNGGPTLTHYPLQGSLAIDNGYDPLCEAVDQRLFPRPLDGDEDGTATCDIGAMERGRFFVVNKDSDSNTMICTESHCTLREAILAANGSFGADIIQFDIPGAGTHTIRPLSQLPAISSPVLVDGFSQPGAVPNSTPGQPGDSAVLLIELDGSNAGSQASGLTLTGFNGVVQGLAVNGFGQHGIRIIGDGATSNVVAGNFIGTDVSGTGGLGNGGANVFIGDGASGNLIGGEGVGDGNIIAFAGSSGVVVVSNEASGNEIRSNVVFSNGQLGIDLGDDGVTANDVGDGDGGPNMRQNYPGLLAATADLGSTHITGTLNSISMTDFTLEFFANPACDGSGYGQGQRPLGLAVVSTNSGGDVGFNVTVPVEAGTNEFVSATATDPAGNSSEFGGCVVAIDAPIRGLSVTNSSPTPLGYYTTLMANLDSGGNVNALWDFGDGTTGSGRIVNHYYPALGVYTTVVTVSNSTSSNIITGTTTVTIIEEDPTSVAVSGFGLEWPANGWVIWFVGFVIAVGVWFYGRRRV